jgi:hypothetical protein
MNEGGYIMKYFFFKPSLSFFYTFFSGITVGLATNLFATGVLSVDLNISRCVVYIAGLLLILSSVGNIMLSWYLNDINDKWISLGKPKDLMVKMALIEGRLKRLWSFLLLSVCAFFGTFVLLWAGLEGKV